MSRMLLRGRAGLRTVLAIAVTVLAGQGAVFAGQVVPVPAVVIYPGDLIRDGMLTERELPSDFAGEASSILDRAALVGKSARRTLLPGLPIASNAVGEPKIVAAGAMVRVTFVEGGLTISTYASALQAGATGDVIPLRNRESGLTVSGTIQADGSVRVGNG